VEAFENFIFEYGVHFWLIIGILLGAVEILTVSFLALPFALGAIITALFTYLGVPFTGQLFIFTGSSLVMLFVIQFTVKKYFTSEEGSSMQTNVDALVGREALVMSPISGSVTRGAVKVGGETWSAITSNGNSFEKDDVVVIDKVDGAKVIVSKLES